MLKLMVRQVLHNNLLQFRPGFLLVYFDRRGEGDHSPAPPSDRIAYNCKSWLVKETQLYFYISVCFRCAFINSFLPAKNSVSCKNV